MPMDPGMLENPIGPEPQPRASSRGLAPPRQLVWIGRGLACVAFPLAVFSAVWSWPEMGDPLPLRSYMFLSWSGFTMGLAVMTFLEPFRSRTPLLLGILLPLAGALCVLGASFMDQGPWAVRLFVGGAVFLVAGLPFLVLDALRLVLQRLRGKESVRD